MPSSSTLTNSSDGASARLNQLLDAIGFTPKGKGRGAKFKTEFGVGISTATRWLAKDELPSDPLLAKKIRDALGTSLDYWYYGYESDVSSQQVNHAFECAAAVHQNAAELGLEMDSLPYAARLRLYQMVFSDSRTKKGKLDKSYIQNIVGLLLDLRQPSDSRSGN